METLPPPGLYGKLYVQGDFVSRRLPPSFIETWDAWLQGALSASRDRLDGAWLDVYLTSPIWRFGLSPGICGDSAWAGILMPSVDSVGRYFPLTLAGQIGLQRSLPETFRQAAKWFEGLEHLALSALEDGFDVTSFDQKLQAQIFSPYLPDSEGDHFAEIQTIKEGKFHYQAILDDPGGMKDAFVGLGDFLLDRFVGCYSIWATPGSEILKPALMVYQGLPPVEAYYDMLLAGQNPKADTTVEPVLSVALEDNNPLQPVEIKLREDRSEGMCFHWHSAARTTVGKRRQVNEDAFLERPEIGLWAVADGMGGHSKGDVASHAVVHMLNTLSGSGNLETLAAATVECLSKVNSELMEKAASFGPEETIGTTVVVMLAAGERCAALWVGDSRLYRYRGGELRQLTRDHAPQNEIPHPGESADETFVDGPSENIVTRAVGGERELLVDSVAFEATEGEVYLLCSDGLYRELAADDIGSALGDRAPHESAQRLIDMALERGARDNVTVIVVRAGQIC